MSEDQAIAVPTGDAVTSPSMQRIVTPDPQTGVPSPQMPHVPLPTPINDKVAPPVPKK